MNVERLHERHTLSNEGVQLSRLVCAALGTQGKRAKPLRRCQGAGVSFTIDLYTVTRRQSMRVN